MYLYCLFVSKLKFKAAMKNFGFVDSGAPCG